MNSWLGGSGHMLQGRFEILSFAQRSTSYDMVDTTVSTTQETADMTALCGTDVAWLYCVLSCGDGSSAYDRSLLWLSEIGTTVGNRSFLMWASAQSGTGGGFFSCNMWIPAHGTDPGKFWYREHSSTYQVASLYCQYRGKIRP